MKNKQLKNFRHKQKMSIKKKQHYNEYVTNLNKILNNEYQGKSVYAGLMPSKILHSKTASKFDSTLNDFRKNVIIPHLLNVKPSSGNNTRLGLNDSNVVTVYGYISDYKQDRRKGHIGSLLIDNPHVITHNPYTGDNLADRLLDSHMWVKMDRVLPMINKFILKRLNMSGRKLEIGIGDLIVFQGMPTSYRSHTKDHKPVYKWKLDENSMYFTDCGQLISSSVTKKIDPYESTTIMTGYDHGDDWVIKYKKIPKIEKDGSVMFDVEIRYSQYPTYKERFNLK